MTARTPTPPWFAELAHTKNKQEWAKELGCSIQAVKRMARELGVEMASAPSRKFPVPEDFAERAKVQCTSDLSSHYGVGLKKVIGWARELGITIMRARDDPARRQLLALRNAADEDESDAIMDSIYADRTPHLEDATLFYRALQAFRPAGVDSSLS